MLLQAKFFPPAPGQQTVLRRGLLNALDALARASVILVHAPGGYGKSMLMSQWLSQRDAHYAWLSLDSKDNDAVRFWRYFTAAFSRSDSEIGMAIGRQESLFHGSDGESTVNRLLNLLYEQNQQTPFYLVLDDFHHIDNETILNTLAQFLDRVPPFVKVFILSRTEPQLMLQQRSSGLELAQMNASDLAFDAQEGREYFNQKMALDLTDQELAEVFDSVEGWIAGMQMVALSMSGGPGKAAFLEALQSSNVKQINDYLISEVLLKQPDPIQSFLVQTAFLPRLNEALCQRVVGGDLSVRLSDVVHRNLFLIGLDAQQEWYRYHDLFKELLQKRFERLELTAQHTLMLRASDWFEEHQMLAEALDLALAAKDWPRASKLLEQIGPQKRQQAEVYTLSEWFTALDRNSLMQRPKLLILAIWTYTYLNQLNIASFYSDSLRDLIGAQDLETAPIEELNILGVATEQERAKLLAEYNISRALLYRLQSQHDEARKYSTRAYEVISKVRLATPSIYYFGYGQDQFLNGEVYNGIQALHEAIEHGMAEREIYNVVVSCGFMVLASAHTGKVRQTMATLERVSQWLREAGVAHYPVARMLELFAADLHRELGEVEHAVEMVKAAAPEVLPYATPVVQIAIDTFSLYTAMSAGDGQWASQLLQELKALHDKVPNVLNFSWPRPVALEALLGWLEGRSSTYRAWALARYQELQDDLRFTTEKERVIIARLLVDAGEYAKAQALLENVIATCERQDRFGPRIQAYLIEAGLYFKQDNKVKAADKMMLALDTAKPFDYVSTLVEEGPRVLQIIKWMQGRKEYPVDWSRWSVVLQALEQRFGGEDEPLLSSRELEVLRLIDKGYTNQDVADKLFISLSTVKTHTKHIYTKLGVTSRTQALTRAREKHLLES